MTRLSSLGIHEHWNDPVNMQYTRNLGTGDGIELIRRSSVTHVPTHPSDLSSYSYPNPFNPRTMIHFELVTSGQVELGIYNAVGARVATLLHGNLDPGEHEVTWLGRDDTGRNLPSGTYYYWLRQGTNRETGKMTLIR